jgi:hypothetical protein
MVKNKTSVNEFNTKNRKMLNHRNVILPKCIVLHCVHTVLLLFSPMLFGTTW